MQVLLLSNISLLATANIHTYTHRYTKWFLPFPATCTHFHAHTSVSMPFTSQYLTFYSPHLYHSSCSSLSASTHSFSHSCPNYIPFITSSSDLSTSFVRFFLSHVSFSLIFCDAFALFSQHFLSLFTFTYCSFTVFHFIFQFSDLSIFLIMKHL